MNRFATIASHLEEWGLDALMLTEEHNRFYATGFHCDGADAVAVITREKNYYFTDSRYTEAASRAVKDAEFG